MRFTETKLKGAYVIELEPMEDERGFFARTFCKEEFAKAGVDFTPVQISQSVTKKKGTIRGMHFQKPPKEEDRIVQCVRGNIYDVIVDLYENSPTFGKWIARELREDNGTMLYVPRGFAHGFQALEDNCLVQYTMSEFYSSEYQGGVRWNDPLFDIPWPIKEPLLSPRDKAWPLIGTQ